MPASQTSMSELNLPLLYRHILRAAQRFPSIKRDSIVQEIKAEFAANKVSPAHQPFSLAAPSPVSDPTKTCW